MYPQAQQVLLQKLQALPKLSFQTCKDRKVFQALQVQQVQQVQLVLQVQA
jgi:hypothetical protein